ncbi:MAG: hypothetical protein M1814_000257 [Vezdaea aestivalis]|nr:MAG: hypothetical protein M1814_000257 [Vezdaea aestivalis]
MAMLADEWTLDRRPQCWGGINEAALAIANDAAPAVDAPRKHIGGRALDFVRFELLRFTHNVLRLQVGRYSLSYIRPLQFEVRSKSGACIWPPAMAPVVVYIRINQFDILPGRVLLTDPGLKDSWLLKAGDPKLPVIVKAVHHYALQQLNEIREFPMQKAKKKPKYKKDVIIIDGYIEIELWVKDNEDPGHFQVVTRDRTFKDFRSEEPSETEDILQDRGFTYAGKEADKSNDWMFQEVEPIDLAHVAEAGSHPEPNGLTLPDEKDNLQTISIYEGHRVIPYTLYMLVHLRGQDPNALLPSKEQFYEVLDFQN